MHSSARSSRGGRQQRAPPALYGHPIPQSHSFGGYYQPSPYAADLSPIPNYHAPPPPHPPHYGGHQHPRPHHSPAMSWPAPPSSSTAEIMDVQASPSPPDLATADASSFSISASPISSAEEVEASAAASTLSNLANASAGPLKKRRKIEETVEAKQPGGKDSSVTAQFPSMLHKLLARASDKDNKDGASIASALEWLPHGKGWRVLRWDALCSEVLPREFPGLCDAVFPKPASEKVGADAEGRDDADGKETGKYTDEQWVDAFLWHVRAFGFEEVLAGRNRGSFCHELFVKESPEQCHNMKVDPHRRHTPILTPIQLTPRTDVEIAWRKSHKAVSSIFKPPRHRNHPAHLHVPVLTSTGTSSFAETWGAEHGHVLPPHPPPTGRSPGRTIRFRDEEEEPALRQRDDAVEITPSPATAGRKTLSSARGGYGGFVSRRGRRPGLISRHATH